LPISTTFTDKDAPTDEENGAPNLIFVEEWNNIDEVMNFNSLLVSANTISKSNQIYLTI
jgi:hypothetical protein